MDDKARILMKKKLQEGMQVDEIRSIFISEGYDTDELYEEYLKIKNEAGATLIPSPKSPHLPGSFASFVENEASAARSSKENMLQKRSRTFMKLFIVFFILVVWGMFAISSENTGWQRFFGKIMPDTQEGLTAADIANRTQLNSMQLSARAYKSKLTDYSGLCQSIGIDHSIYTCSENADAYIIRTKLSNDLFYCVDSTGFADMVSSSRGNSFSCQ